MASSATASKFGYDSFTWPCRLLASAEQYRTGIAGKLLQGADDSTLWMETYEGVRDAESFSAIIGELLKPSGFETFLAPGSSRVTERFVASSA